MPTNACYYLYLSAITLALSIYNFEIANEGKELECFKPQTMSESEFGQYVDSFKQRVNTTDDEFRALFNLKLLYPIDNFNDTHKTDNFTVAVYQGNQYKPLVELIAIFYIVIVALAIILAFLTFKMADMVPDDFINISKFKLFFACFCKILPMMLVILHYIILVIIIVIWGFNGTKSCYLSASPLPGVLKNPTYYYQQVLILNIVTTIFWMLIHFGGAIIRDATYQEPYMYAPMVGKSGTCSYVILKKLGP
jgi:hypothetical protein